MNYDKLIKNWHTKASEEDYFSKFVFEYLAFIAFLRKKLFTDCGTDRCALQRLKQNEIRHAYINKIQSNRKLNRSWERIKHELERSRLGNTSGAGDVVEEVKWWNCSHGELQDQTIEEEDRVKGVIHSLVDWANMVEFWSAIRNNLFHGGKNPEDKRDKVLVEHGFIALQALMDLLLED